ncbi:MAG: PAS domain-containing sensor histidine kinase [Burkholderiales bacterium]
MSDPTTPSDADGMRPHDADVQEPRLQITVASIQDVVVANGRNDGPAVKRASAAIATSELRYRRLFEAARDGIFLVDPDTRKITDANPFMVELLGYGRDELIGKELWEIGLLRDEEDSRAAFEKLSEHGYIRYEDLPLQTKAGGRREVEFVSNLYQEGDRQVIQCNIRDITERKLAEKALRDNEERYRLLVDGVKDYAIFRLDPAGHVTSWNVGAERINGYREDEILGTHFRCFYPAEAVRDGEPERELDAAAAHGRFEDEGWRVRKNGSRFWASVVVTALREAGGGLQGFAKITRDVTERKQLEDELRRRAEQLAEADRRKDEFIAVLAHELRNPLNSIGMAARLLRQGGEKEREWALGAVDRQLATLGRLTEDLLDAARLSTGKIHLWHESVNLHRAIMQAIDSVSEFINERKHNLEITTPSYAMMVDGDPTRLEQVFVNLLTNAAKYTERGGRISLTAEADGKDYLVRIRDNGEGIAAAMLPHLFEMFTQVESSTQLSGGGLGIGLALVKNLVEMHGGTVGGASEGVGRGSEFTVRLPAADMPVASA